MAIRTTLQINKSTSVFGTASRTQLASARDVLVLALMIGQTKTVSFFFSPWQRRVRFCFQEMEQETSGACKVGPIILDAINRAPNVRNRAR